MQFLPSIPSKFKTNLDPSQISGSIQTIRFRPNYPVPTKLSGSDQTIGFRPKYPVPDLVFFKVWMNFHTLQSAFSICTKFFVFKSKVKNCYCFIRFIWIFKHLQIYIIFSKKEITFSYLKINNTKAKTTALIHYKNNTK